ncbi:lanthionine synthetase C family protein [Paenibacillus sp. P26]|nr:lanthionine synthetase C family protein [Paenibacillus sp. P26]
MWKPILDGPMREEALETACGIVRELREQVPGITDPTLCDGLTGIAVLFDYYAKCTGDTAVREEALEPLEQGLSALEHVPMAPALHEGFAGIAWAAVHLAGATDREASDEWLEPVDAALLEPLERSPWQGDYDLMRGLVGYGLYALEKGPTPYARKMVTAVVNRLSELAETREEGVTWFTPKELLTEYALQEGPHGYYNLGLAHGVPGVIGFLGRACEAGVPVPAAKPLLERSVAWLLAQSFPPEAQSLFPRCVGPEIEPAEARLAWCYGDPGVSAALLMAARCAGEASWEREAVRIAGHAARRPFDSSGVLDASFCHGASGVAHMLNRVHQAAGDEELGRATVKWLRYTLDLRRRGEGIGGYLSRVFEPDGPNWAAEPGILSGAAGVALVLLAASSDVQPDWDRMFLLSAPAERG